MQQALARAVLLASLAVASAQPAGATTYGYLAFDVPGATNTFALGINNSQQIVGSFDDASGVRHGFLKDGDSYTTIDVPGAVSTNAWGINDAGQVVGGFEDSAGDFHGFLKDGETYITIDVPGAYGLAAASDLNNLGQVVGFGFSNGSASHGSGFALLAPSSGGSSFDGVGIFDASPFTISGSRIVFAIWPGVDDPPDWEQLNWDNFRYTLNVVVDVVPEPSTFWMIARPRRPRTIATPARAVRG